MKEGVEDKWSSKNSYTKEFKDYSDHWICDISNKRCWNKTVEFYRSEKYDIDISRASVKKYTGDYAAEPDEEDEKGLLLLPRCGRGKYTDRSVHCTIS